MCFHTHTQWSRLSVKERRESILFETLCVHTYTWNIRLLASTITKWEREANREPFFHEEVPCPNHHTPGTWGLQWHLRGNLMAVIPESLLHWCRPAICSPYEIKMRNCLRKAIFLSSSTHQLKYRCYCYDILETKTGSHTISSWLTNEVGNYLKC